MLQKTPFYYDTVPLASLPGFLLKQHPIPSPSQKFPESSTKTEKCLQTNNITKTKKCYKKDHSADDTVPLCSLSGIQPRHPKSSPFNM